MEVSRTVLIELSANTLLSFLSKLQRERRLTNEEMELVVTKALNDVKSAKELDYASQILNLTYQIQQLEADKNKEEENENGESV